MATLLETRLRESMVEFYETYNRARQTSIFARLVMDMPAPAGFFKPTALALPGEPSQFMGNAIVHSIESAAATALETLVYEYTLGIDRNLLEKTDELSRGAVSRIIQGMVNKAIGHMDKKLTTLLLTGESTGNLAGGAFFSATVTLPGGNTMDNIVGTSVSGSAAEVRGAIHAAQHHFISMRNAGNDLARGDMPVIGVMYDPRATNTTLIGQSVMDAIRPDRLDGGYIFEAGSVVPIPNGYFSGSIADLFFFDLNAVDKPFIAGWQQRPVLESNVGVRTDSDRLLNRRDLFQTSWAYECSFGSPYAAVLGNDA